MEELTDKQVAVIPTRTVPQGIAALLVLDASAGAEQNRAQMLEAAGLVKTGSVTFAARDSEMDGRTFTRTILWAFRKGKLPSLERIPMRLRRKLSAGWRMKMRR